MGVFKRLIGKFAGSDFVRRAIGLAAGHLSKHIGKAESVYRFAKLHPDVAPVLDAVENSGVGKRVRRAVNGVKHKINDAQQYADYTSDKKDIYHPMMGGQRVD